jgi:hypothetical protein
MIDVPGDELRSGSDSANWFRSLDGDSRSTRNRSVNLRSIVPGCRPLLPPAASFLPYPRTEAGA